MSRDDIVLVIYINIGQKPIPEAEKYMESVKKNIEGKTAKFTVFFVPIRYGDSKIECINPTVLDKKEYSTNVSRILVEYQLKLEEFLAKPEPKKRTKKVEETKPEPPPAETKVVAKPPKKIKTKIPEPEPVKVEEPVKKRTRSK